MWSLSRVPDGAGWQWDMNYEMSFENIWNDHSYTATRLPRTVPVLALVSPSDPDLVYFALEQNLFGVNVPEHRVLHREGYELVKMPEPEPQHPASGRYVIAWELPPAIAQALGMDHPFAGLDAEQLPAEHDTESEEQGTSESQSEEEPVVDLECKEQLADIFSYSELMQMRENNSSKLSVDEISDEEANRGLAVEMDQVTLSTLKAEVKKFAEDHLQVSVKATSSASAALKDSVGSTAEGATSTSGIRTWLKRPLKLNLRYHGPDWVPE
ncbi:hypothetical protein BS78_08G043700 [Paspalum vaginatum]|nr:hypothetical protein BS78_08G043700 [Paspalum vaginatum]